MNFSIDKGFFNKAVQSACRIATAKSSLPVLQNVLLEAKDNGSLKVVSSDLEMSIETMIPARVEAPGSITIQARRLGDILSNLPDEDTVGISLDDNKMANLVCGKAKYKLSTIPAEEYPTMKTDTFSDSFTMPGEALSAIIHQTLFASSQEEEDPVVNGCLLEFEEEKLVLVSTDKKRLAISRSVAEGASIPKGGRIIHRKTLSEISKMAAEAPEFSISFGAGQVRFECENRVLISRLISGEFPNYRGVTPNGYSKEATINIRNLRESLKGLVPVARDNSNIISLETTNKGLVLSAVAPQVGEARLEMEAKVSGEPGTVAFNVNYLIDALSVMDGEEVKFRFGQPLQPLFFECGAFMYILMPVRNS